MDNNELDDLASRASFVVNMLGQIVTPAPSEDARQPLRLFSELLLAAERERCDELTDDMLRYAMSAMGTGSPADADKFRRFWRFAIEARGAKGKE